MTTCPNCGAETRTMDYVRSTPTTTHYVCPNGHAYSVSAEGETRHSLTFGERQMLPMEDGALAYLGADATTRRDMVRRARIVQATMRQTYGYAGAADLLTAPAAQAKLAKSAAPTYGLSLLPASGLGEYAVEAFGRPVNLCPMATAGCEAACLNTAGKGRLSSVQRARMVRSMFLLLHPVAAGVLLAHEIDRAAARHAAPIRVRLNVLSDVRWELVLPRTIGALRATQGVRFYDYTKWTPAKRSAAAGLVHLTYSASERMTLADIVALHDAGHGVAVVFAASKATVKAACKAGATWHGMRLVDGLSTDDRTTDPGACIVALSALGDGVADTSGFVRSWDVALAA